MSLVLVSGRTLGQGKTRDKEKLTEGYFDAAAFVELDADDADDLGIEEGDVALLETGAGEVRLRAKTARGDSSGVAFVPMGPWANALVDDGTEATGMPEFKSVPVKVEKTDGSPTTLDDLLGE
ncbi:MAG: Molybdenum-containing formylmethanofuran dehydrogenase 1 subunit C [Methanonatronarchaeales archaeon]|nr:Molybdenum-containing formylmethanofuran dehydrogenase 1 subunit C [Methanonatronarchaeales archaeon]